MDSYTTNKCVENNSLPSLYVDNANLELVRHKLDEISVVIIQIEHVFILRDDRIGYNVELVHLESNDLFNIKSMCSLLSRMKLKFAYPWHQSWFKNNSKSNVELEKLDNFDLISLQIEDHRLNHITTGLIKSKLDSKSTRFDLNKYLFDNNRNTVEEEILLHFLYHYGRHYYTEVVWLADVRGTQLLDDCINEMNLKIINSQYVELALDGYDNVDDLLKRLWLSKHQLSIKIGSTFTSAIFQKLMACDFVTEIIFDVGLGADFSILDGHKLEHDEFAGRSSECKYFTIHSTTQTKRVDHFIDNFKKFTNCRLQNRYFYLTMDGVIPEDWSLLNGLNITEIIFKNVKITIEHLAQLALCKGMSANLKFIDCQNFNDDMLQKFLNSCKWIRKLSMSGQSAITANFFKLFAHEQIVRYDLYYYDFREEEMSIEVEGFEKYTERGRFIIDEFIED